MTNTKMIILSLLSVVLSVTASVQAKAMEWREVSDGDNVDVASNRAEAYRVTTSGRVYRYYDDFYWFDITTNLPGRGATRVCADSDGNPWVVGRNGKIYRGTVAGNWQTIEPPPNDLATDIGCNAGQVFITGSGRINGGYIYRLKGSTWYKIQGEAQSVAVDMDGLPWVVNKQGRVYHGNGWGGWTRYGDAYVDGVWTSDYRALDVAPFGYLYSYTISQSTNDIYWLYDSYDWYEFYFQPPVLSKRIALSPNHIVWAVGTNGHIYIYLD